PNRRCSASGVTSAHAIRAQSTTRRSSGPDRIRASASTRGRASRVTAPFTARITRAVNVSSAEECHVRTCCRLALSTFVVLAPAAVFAQQTATPPPAQTPPAAAQAQEPQPPPPFVPAPVNIFDFGLRGTSVNGDAARYQRYRDLRSGPFLDDVRIRREKKDWLFDMAGQHVGWRDQRYVGAITRPGVLKAWGFWDQIPMHMSETTSTLFVEKIA